MTEAQLVEQNETLKKIILFQDQRIAGLLAARADLQRLSVPKDEDLRVRLVWTRQEEEELKREGWKEVPHE